MNKSSEINNTDSSTINTKWVLLGIGVSGFIILVLYFFNFHHGISVENGDWGSFGDYFAGILNPVIAVFVLYWIGETFKLQKTELEETRKLLKVSTDAQKVQIELAALTALLNSNLTRISLLESEKIALLQGMLPVSVNPKTLEDDRKQGVKDLKDSRRPPGEVRNEKIKTKLDDIENEINELTEKNNKLEEQLHTYEQPIHRSNKTGRRLVAGLD